MKNCLLRNKIQKIILDFIDTSPLENGNCLPVEMVAETLKIKGYRSFI